MTNTYDIIGIEDFANSCSFSLHGNVLVTRCHLRDMTGKVYTLQREVDLAPAIEFVARNLAAWHAAQHGEAPTVSGWSDWVSKATSAVKKVAQNKTVHSLYEQAKPFLKSAVKELPGGQTAMELANKAANVYDRAKKGSQQALATIKKVKAIAEEGNAKAQYVVKVMQKVSEIVQAKEAGVPNPVLPEVASALQKRRSYYNLGVTAVSGDEMLDLGASPFDLARAAAMRKASKKAAKRSGVRDRRNPTSRGGFVQSKALNKAWGARNPIAPPPRGMSYDTRRPMVPPGLLPDGAQPTMAMPPQPGDVPAPLAASSTAQSPGGVASDYSTTPDLPSDMYDDAQLYDEYMPEEAVDEYYDHEGEPDDEEGQYDVSGWRYNKRYRTTSEYLLQSQHSPGVAMAARELYNRGLGRPKTSLSSLASQALKMF